MFRKTQSTVQPAAKFLTTTGVSHHLEKIINGAEERLVLISPYLKVNQRIQDLLADKTRMNLDIHIVYGKRELSSAQSEWLSSMPSIHASYVADLHAKCYLNEKSALITSMNLYEFSQVNNIEMGMLVNRDADKALYNDILTEVHRILRTSKKRRMDPSDGTATDAGGRSVPGRVMKQNGKQRTSEERGSAGKSGRGRAGKSGDRPSSSHIQPPKPENGFCIRCRGQLPADPLKPYCGSCYKTWSRYKNDDYKEKYCHLCGGDHATTFGRPVCKPCYNTYKAQFTFSSGK